MNPKLQPCPDCGHQVFGIVSIQNLHSAFTGFSSERSCATTLIRPGRMIFIAGAHRGDGKRFVVRADEKLSAFVELEREVLTVAFYLESIQ